MMGDNKQTKKTAHTRADSRGDIKNKRTFKV